MMESITACRSCGLPELVTSAPAARNSGFRGVR